MDQFALELSLEVVEGSTHNLGDLTLWCQLRANTYNPLQPRPQMVALWRTHENWSPPAVSEPEIRNEQVSYLIKHLQTLAWPGRELQLSAVEAPLAGVQAVRLWIRLDGREGELRLELQYGGLAGADAEGVRNVLRALVELGGLPSQEHWIVGT